MESYQIFSPSFKSSPIMADNEKLKGPELIKPNSEDKATEISPKTTEGYIGSLDVFIHEARDIHNICIYHKQDVYAKLSLTTDPESAVSTQIINGGGRNPVFNQSLKLDVKTIDSSLKCEVWMLSRVKNYLEDQLLGFALVPLSDVVVANGKLVQEFSLSSTDLFHSPAGFVQLSISYSGSSPEVLAITPRPKESPVMESDECELEKIEFPDLKVVNENNMMVSEYYGIPCTDLDTHCAEELIITDSDECLANEEAGVRVVESFVTANSPDSVGILKQNSPDSVGDLKNDTPPTSVSTNESPSEKDKSTEAEAEAESSIGTINNAFMVNIEPEQSVVQQDIVDMYMKSMQQFTESLANMKLPMDLENNGSSTSSGSSNGTGNGNDKKLQEAKKVGSRVFYGSRAFF